MTRFTFNKPRIKYTINKPKVKVTSLESELNI